jgi:hypothetical protein
MGQTMTAPIPAAKAGAGVILGDPSKNAIEVILRRFADDDLHTP